MKETPSGSESHCPHCGKPVAIGAPYCPACGYRIHRVSLSASPPPVNWWLVPVLLIAVPLAACGGCFLFDVSSNAMGFALAIEAFSVVAGLIVLIVNCIDFLTRKR